MSSLFASVTLHFAFKSSPFTLSLCGTLHALRHGDTFGGVIVCGCQGSHLALVRRRGTRSFRVCCVCLAWSDCMVTHTETDCKHFFALFALSAFCTVWSGLHCASCYSVHSRTACARGRARARVWGGSQRAFWGALGAFWGWGGIGHGGGRERAHRGL